MRKRIWSDEEIRLLAWELARAIYHGERDRRLLRRRDGSVHVTGRRVFGGRSTGGDRHSLRSMLAQILAPLGWGNPRGGVYGPHEIQLRRPA